MLLYEWFSFFFFYFSQKNGSVGRWETKHFMGMALSIVGCFVVHDHLWVNQLLTLVLLTERLKSLKVLNVFPVEKGYHLTRALHLAQQFHSLNSPRQSLICIHRLTTALPLDSFYNIGIILLLLFCVCFPFINRSNKETLRLSLADIFCVYILLL